MSIITNTKLLKVISKWRNQICYISYVQGQEPEPKIREYFYFIDHQGMVSNNLVLARQIIGNKLFLDDSRMKNFTSCFKEKEFLKFFFTRLKINNSGRYSEFPYISLCGRERNYVRCDDYPIVFTHLIDENTLSYNHAGNLLTSKFEPEKVYMLPTSGRVYHPAPGKTGSIGLVRSKLAIEFSKYFEFQNGEAQPPTHFKWCGRIFTTDNKWYNEAKKKSNVHS